MNRAQMRLITAILFVVAFVLAVRDIFGEEHAIRQVVKRPNRGSLVCENNIHAGIVIWKIDNTGMAMCLKCPFQQEMQKGQAKPNDK